MDDERMLGALLGARDALNDPQRWNQGDWFQFVMKEDEPGYTYATNTVARACLVGHLGLGAGFDHAVVSDCEDHVEMVLNELAAFVSPFADEIATLPPLNEPGMGSGAVWYRLAEWNDDLRRTIDQVRLALDNAIAAKRAQMGVQA